MSRISLDSRLERLKKGMPSDPTLARHVLEAIVDVTMRDLLVDDDTISHFAEALGIDIEKASSMTYGQASVRIHDMWSDKLQRSDALDALLMLARPFMVEHRRREMRAKNKP